MLFKIDRYQLPKEAKLVMLSSILALASYACTAPTTTVETPSPLSSATPTTNAPASQQIAQTNLQTYNETAAGIPVTTQYPESMAVNSSGSSEGIGVFFTFQPQGNALDDAEVHVFLPSGVATAAAQEPFVTGANGLIENNDWTVDSTDTDGSSKFPYAWVKQIINFSTDKEQSGHILLGETNGQAIQVTLLYPAEMSDAYWSAATPILENLTFDANQLPVRRSSD